MFSGSDCGAGGVGIEDRAFVFTAARNGPFTFSTEGSRFDTLISVREEGCDGYELACDDAQVRGGAAVSEVTVELRECQSVTVIVDGHDFWSDGRFTLSISGTETVCGDRRDDDGDGLVDCDDPDCLGANCDDENMQWPIDAAQLEWAMLNIVNARRAEGAVCGDETMPPVPPLEMNVVVREAARLHSRDMANQDYFDHTGLDGRSPSERIRDVGFAGPAPLGENIQKGSATAEGAMESLMNSPGHCSNIMDRSFRVMGIGFANDGTASGNYWTQNFAGGH